MGVNTIVTLFRYKRWIDIETLQAIKRIDASANAEKAHLTLRLMNHIHVVDMILRANINGPEAFLHCTRQRPPLLMSHLITMAECTNWYIQHANSMPPVDLAETIKFQFVDGESGEMKAIDMLNHVLFHGTYHRGAVGWLLSESGVTPPKDVLTVFLRDHNHE
ncbi:DinB family protein [Yersinia alsatica]|uniref:DinB family protein n=1 Tax=Yersinia alsatica TaxID=2890317 RepID=UPI0032EB9E89